MLQSKGLSARATEEDHERTRRLADAEMTIHQLEGLLEQKDKEMLQLREVCVCACVCASRHSHVCGCVYLVPARCECVQIKPCHIQAQSLAHSSVLIQHRNLKHTHKTTGGNTLSSVFTLSFLTSYSALLTLCS